MSEILDSLLSDRWVRGRGDGAVLTDPVSGSELARVSAAGLDLAAGFEFARSQGGSALRAMSFEQRAGALAKLVDVFKANRERYLEISIANSGTTRADSSPDVDGAIFTLGYYARLGAGLGEARHLVEGAAASLDKAGSYQARHIMVPARGLVLCINAFNFPAWGLWEKAAPALLSGVPVVAKPATATCWLTRQMVADAVAADALPPGALSLVCGNPEGLLDALEPFDLLSFTGSAHTAAMLRSHPAVAARSVRVNVEADSLNSVLLDRAVTPGSEHFNRFAKDVVRELCVKSGQRCTAPRRIFVPGSHFDAAREALSAGLAAITVGDPRQETVRMGSLVSAEQKRKVLADLDRLGAETERLFDGSKVELRGADPVVSACVAPTLLGLRDGERARLVHDVEVFGPVATLIAYRDFDEAVALIRRGQGSLVSSVYAASPEFAAQAAIELADCHGRIHTVTPAVAATHSGHGNVMPASIHGGPGRAGGGEELGGLRALNFYHRRCAVQIESSGVGMLDAGATSLAI